MLCRPLTEMLVAILLSKNNDLSIFCLTIGIYFDIIYYAVSNLVLVAYCISPVMMTSKSTRRKFGGLLFSLYYQSTVSMLYYPITIVTIFYCLISKKDFKFIEKKT